MGVIYPILVYYFDMFLNLPSATKSTWEVLSSVTSGKLLHQAPQEETIMPLML